MIHEIVKYPDIPSLSHSINVGSDTFWVTFEGNVGITFRGRMIDVEAVNLEAYHLELSNLIKDLHPELLFKVHTHTVAKNLVEFPCSRSEAISERGYVQHQVLISFELKPPFGFQRLLSPFQFRKIKTEDKVERLRAILPKSAIKSLNLVETQSEDLVSLNQEEIEEYFSFDRIPITLNSDRIKWGNEFVSVIRLWKPVQGEYPLDLLSCLRPEFPLPVDIVVSMQRLDSEWAELLLKRKKKSLEGLTAFFSTQNRQETDIALAELLMREKSLVQVEYQFVLRRNTDQELRQAEAALLERVKLLGDVMIEESGAAPSLIATLPGSNPHYRYFENSHAIAAILPVFTFGEQNSPRKISPSALALHRLDGSLHFFDLFSKKFISYCAAFIGLPGSGKSVTTQLLLAALMKDPDTLVTIVDVEGSWSRSVAELGGIEKSVELGQPSSLSPFRFLPLFDQDQRNEAALLIAGFLGRLIAEPGEKELPTEIKAKLEKSLMSWLESNPSDLSFEAYLTSASDVPRKYALERWRKGQIFENVLAGDEPYERTNRLQYINFTNVFQAGDSDLAWGGFAAILSQILLECQIAKKAGKRFVIICDETALFIQKAGFFFGFAARNIRKLNQSLIVLTQNSKDLELTQAANPMELLSNLNSFFLFTVDGTEAEYQARLKLTDEELAKVKSLRSEPGKFSQVMLKARSESRVLQMLLSTEEEWTTTSEPGQKSRMKLIGDAFPGLSRKEVILCLAFLDRKRKSSF